MERDKYIKKEGVRINERIRTNEVRLIDANGENIGVVLTSKAIAMAKDIGLDLIEISPNTEPPIAKIMDYGKFQYDQKKKLSAQKAKSHIVEVKSVQIKVATGEHDLELKANRATEWLNEGHRVKVELFLKGRTKFMEKEFLTERLQRILKLVKVDYNVAEGPSKNPKGMYVILEKKR